MAKRTSPKGKPAQPSPEEQTIKAQAAQNNEKKRRLILIIAGAVAFAASLVIYLLRLDKVVGFVVDDAWYVLLAKAMATGHGYTIINSPSPGIVPFYAPGFPALLSIFYRLAPSFPGNIIVFKLVSTAAMLGVGFLAFHYFRRYRELPTYVAFALALTTATYPALAFLATSSVMSEPVFTFTQLAAIVVIERCVRAGQEKSAWLFAALGGALASYAFLTRPAGLGLLVGAVIYLFKEKLAKSLLIFAAVTAVLVGPWMVYSRSHPPTPEQVAEQDGNIVQPYTKQIWQRMAGTAMSGTITAGELPERVWNNLSEIARYDFGALAFYSLYRPLEPGEALRIPVEARMISLFLTALAIAGFVWVAWQRLTLAEIVVPLAIGVMAIWGWEQYRLLLPAAPFLLFYLLMGVRLIARLYQKLYSQPNPRGELVPLLIVSWLFAISSVYGNVQYIQKKYAPVPEERLQWISAFEENEALIKHISENVPKDEVIATQNPALVHLYTGHKTVALDDPASQWETWNRIGVRYLARTSPFPLPRPETSENKYRTIFRTSGPLGLRLVDLGSPSARPAWGKN
ncbi:MAG: hypothetical protein ACREBD_05945 [Blastocatellia bacterium]